MKDDTRMIATVVIWACFTIIIGIIAAVLAVARPDLNLIGIAAVLIIILSLMATVANSTAAIWGFKSEPEDERLRSAKFKNRERSRIERLIAELDDDDIYDLEALLLTREEHSGSDGELARDRFGPRT